MARNKTIGPDQFSATVEELFSDVLQVGNEAALVGVRSGIRKGAQLWRKHAKARIGEHEYMRRGQTIVSGKYARSIRSHMLSTDEMRPAGEVGSRKLAGLSHLLQFGHARVGGGRVKPVLKLDDAVVGQTFDTAIKAAERYIRRGFR